VGFSIRYRSTERIGRKRAQAIRQACARLVEGHTWLSCEPAHLTEETDGRLAGFSKPTFQPHPDDVAAAQAEGLPDGTTRDLVEILCRLSADFGVDWELSHDYGPIGFILRGVCGPNVLEQMDTFAELPDLISEAMNEEKRDTNSGSARAGETDDDDDLDGPRILPFRPRTPQ
jgi:hypothetical protein